MKGEEELIQLAGGGNLPQQTTMPEIHVNVVQPPTDNTLLWASGVVVPLIIACVGWWFMTRRKK